MPLKLIPPRKGKTPYYAVRGTYLEQYVDRSLKTGKRAVAQKILQGIERQIERGAVPGEAAEPTFASAAIGYMNAGGERQYLAPLIERLGAKPLRLIDQVAIDAAAVALYPNVSGATRNRYVYTPVSSVMKHGGHDGRIKRPKGADGKKLAGWLWPEQAFALFARADDLDAEFGLLLRWLCYTGMRLGEALAVTCDMLRIKERFAYIPDSKNGDARPIYLPLYLVRALRLHPRGLDRGDYRLFKFHKSGHLYALLKAAAAKAEVTMPERQAFHLFCHTWATWMRRYGGLDTKGLTGTGRWRDRKSADRYEHVVVSEEAQRARLLPVPKRARR